MVENNGNGDGILRIGSHGKVKMRYDDSTEIVTIDVIHAWNSWAAIDEKFRDKDRMVPAEQAQEWNLAVYQFACEMLKAPEMSMTDAMHFLKVLREEADKLKVFFEIKSADEPSSRESTELTFSM